MNFRFSLIYFLIIIIFSINLSAQTKAIGARKIIPAIPPSRLVDAETMNKIYEEIKTPYKYGVVIKADSLNELADCPSIFRYKNKWYMMYVQLLNPKIGYQTYLAKSDDLLHWEKLGKILSFTNTNTWDAWQADGGLALGDYNWEGSHKLKKYAGKYWLSYIGGAKKGYETDPLSIGMAWTKNPIKIEEWKRVQENPVLSSKQEDARHFEKLTLYKSQIIHDKSKSLGYDFVMYYNAKTEPEVEKGERIGMAVSNDMVNWSRYGETAVIVNGTSKNYGISGDPQIVKIGDVWVMFYFGAFWKPKAFETFACSYDMVNWTKWDGKHLIEPSETYDQQFAHKPWVVKWKGVVYHFYNAVGKEGRVIAVATSKDLKK